METTITEIAQNGWLRTDCSEARYVCSSLSDRPSTHCTKGDSESTLFSTLLPITGPKVRATKLENPTAIAMVTANSLNKRPTSPSKNVIGTKTATSTSVVATTANPTCLAPKKLATKGDSPEVNLLWIFSSTTILSSTTKPIARTKASSVSRLML